MELVDQEAILENGSNWLRSLDGFTIHIDYVRSKEIRTLLEEMEKSDYYEVETKFDHWVRVETYTKLNSTQRKQKREGKFKEMVEKALNYKELTNKEKKALALEVLSRY